MNNILLYATFSCNVHGIVQREGTKSMGLKRDSLNKMYYKTVRSIESDCIFACILKIKQLVK